MAKEKPSTDKMSTLPKAKNIFRFYPQQVAGHVALVVLKSCPPPLCLTVVLSPQNSDGIPLAERQLVRILSFVIPQSVHRPLVHDTQLLLNACIRESRTLNITKASDQMNMTQGYLTVPGLIFYAFVEISTKVGLTESEAQFQFVHSSLIG